LVEVHRYQLEVYWRTDLQAAKDIEHGIGVFTTRQAHHDPITGLNHVEVGDRAANMAPQAFLELVNVDSRFLCW
jgi:hypothetical protein